MGGETQGADGSENQEVAENGALARVKTEKNHSLVRAWEENEKTKTDNRAEKKVSTITSWENKRKASLEAKLKTTEEALEKKKAENAEKIRNKIASIHKTAEGKKAQVEADYKINNLQAQETADKHRAAKTVPKKPFFGLLGLDCLSLRM